MSETIEIETIEIDASIIAQAAALLDACLQRELKLAVAESCTGGLLAATFTAVPGSSDVFDRGFVTYSDDAKSDMLGVSPALIDRHGAVSEEVARAMVDGALDRSQADLAVSITGIAGPDGGSTEKPVGLVHFAARRRDGEMVHEQILFGDAGRGEIRRLSVARALTLLASLL
jgi:nicotinamide-nucleotide amidase